MSTVTATPVELVEALPRMLGYIPHDSLVIANMPTARSRPVEGSVSIMRLDLPTSADDVDAVLAALADTYLLPGHLAFAGWQDVMLLIWDEHGHSNQHTALAIRRLMRATRENTPYTLTAVLTTTAESILGFCRTTDSATVPIRAARSTTTSELEAQLVLRGRQALPDRATFAAALTADADAAALPPMDVDEETLITIWAQAAQADDSLTCEQSVLLANGLSNPVLRDRALGAIAVFPSETDDIAPLGEQVLSPDDLAHLLDNLSRACRAHTNSPGITDLLTVTSFTAWVVGEGTLASIALERALTINPHHRLARLLNVALSHGLRPPR